MFSCIFRAPVVFGQAWILDVAYAFSSYNSPGINGLYLAA